MTFVQMLMQKDMQKTHLHIEMRASHNKSLSDFGRVFRGPKSVSMHSAPNLEGFNPQLLL